MSKDNESPLEALMRTGFIPRLALERLAMQVLVAKEQWAALYEAEPNHLSPMAQYALGRAESGGNTHRLIQQMLAGVFIGCMDPSRGSTEATPAPPPTDNKGDDE